MFCEKCGAKISDGALFCVHCGNPVRAGAAMEAEEKRHKPEVRVIKPSAAAQGTSQTVISKKSFLPWLLGGIGLLAVAAAAVAALLILKPGKKVNQSASRVSGLTSQNEKSDAKAGEKSAPKKHRPSLKTEEQTEASDTASQSENGTELSAKKGAAELVRYMCYGIFFGADGNLLTYKENAVAFGSSFIMDSIGYATDFLLAHYPDAAVKEDCLYMTEKDVQDYLFHSLGISDISRLKANAEKSPKPQQQYVSYYNGVFGMITPDGGEFFCEEPVITEMQKLNDSEYLVAGSVKYGGWEADPKTAVFRIRMKADPDSIWGGCCLSSVEQWDVYVFPNSNTSYLTKQDLEGLSAESLRRARNEIYARHGYRFNDPELQEYFASTNWYVGTIEPSAFSDSVLNEYEIANRDLIVQYEAEMK